MRVDVMLLALGVMAAPMKRAQIITNKLAKNQPKRIPRVITVSLPKPQSTSDMSDTCGSIGSSAGSSSNGCTLEIHTNDASVTSLDSLTYELSSIENEPEPLERAESSAAVERMASPESDLNEDVDCNHPINFANGQKLRMPSDSHFAKEDDDDIPWLNDIKKKRRGVPQCKVM